MRILCQVGRERDRAIYNGWRRVCEAAGFSFTLWEPDKPAFDVFDETMPNLFIETRDRGRGLIRCIEGRRNLLVVRRHDPRPAFDTYLFQGARRQPNLECQVAFVGNYREDKRDLLDRFILPLAGQFSLKVFGHTRWPLNDYLGPVADETLPHIYKSAEVCVNISNDPRRPSERVYQILGGGGVCISNEFDCENMPVAMSNDSSGFAEFIKTMIKTKGMFAEAIKMGPRVMLARHTYFHRVADIFRDAALGREADQVMELHRAVVQL